jgi:4a-hydroxytetrahydrobiopterin dehydratase
MNANAIPSRLSPLNASVALRKLTGWTLEADERAITKTWALASFDDAVTLFNQIAKLANDQNHHPDVWSSYTQLRVRLWTHDADGLTDKDFTLAKAIDQLSTDHGRATPCLR